MSLTILTYVLTVIKLFFFGGGGRERLRIMFGGQFFFFLNNAMFTIFSQQILYDKLLLVG